MSPDQHKREQESERRTKAGTRTHSSRPVSSRFL